ncbi:pilus assembly protein PilE [Massilia sp. Root418]|uniref:type IV pilin protein n=1 Tax=Massilia sp. Root418 TaxID=1736532 RepID=UPI0006FD8CCB|nr:type IV pilin protein [Massilia sp. Root418]KQW93964.1 pilus assembly protein PilE [Massilia sp. Root418]
MTLRHSHGWTMLEVLIVLVIAMVLAALSYPSYSQFVIRSKRVEGQAALQLLMQQQERYFSANNRYIAFSSASAGEAERRFKWWSGASAARSAYEIEAQACDGESIESCVQLIATPGTARVDRHYEDDECGRLILTSTGLRLATGRGARCWH